MKKNFFKKMSVVLALALTVSAVAPAATTASAAAAPAFKSASVNVKVGQTKSYGMNNVTPWSVKKFVTGNKKVATVAKSGKTAKVTGVGEGKTTLRADLVAYKSKRTLQVRMPVTVKSVEKGLVKVTQTVINKLELTFGAEESLKDLTKEDVIIIRHGDNQKMYVREVNIDGDNAKVLKVETILDMTGSNVFDVTVSGKTLSFTATDGIVAGFKLNTTQIQYDKATMLSLTATDSRGIELVSMDYNRTLANYEFTIDTTMGYIDSDSKLVLPEINDTAKVKAVYHTYKYDDNANEIDKVEKEFVVTAVAKAAIGSYEKYTIAKDKPGDWGSVTVNHELIIDASGDSIDETDVNFFMYAKDTANADVVNGDPTLFGYSVNSSNEDIFFVDGSNTLRGNKPGTAYVVIKDVDGKTIWTMPITVKAEAKAKTFTFSNATLYVTNSIFVNEAVATSLKVKDNYKRDWPGSNLGYTVTCTSAPNSNIKNGINQSNSDYFRANADGEITFFGTIGEIGAVGVQAGTYNYQVKLTQDDANYIQNVKVIVQHPDSNKTAEYKLIIEGTAARYTYDTAINSNNINPKNIEIKMGDYRNGVLYKYVSMDNLTIKENNSNTDLVKSAALVVGEGELDNTTGIGSFKAMAIDTSDTSVTNAVSKAKAATYVVTGVAADPVTGKPITKQQQFIIKDTTTSLTYIKRTDVTIYETVLDAVTDAYKFKMGSNDITVTKVAKINPVNENVLTASGTFKTYVKSIEIYVPIDVNGIEYNIYVTKDINNYVEHLQ